MKRLLRKVCFFVYALVLAAWLLPATSPAATLTLTSLNDNGSGSLREALAIAANGDIIDATSVSGTIYMTSGELLVDKSVSIVGPGPSNLYVNAGNRSRVFRTSSNLVASISGLTVIGGEASNGYSGGGGIYNDHAQLVVSNCAVILNLSRSGGPGFSGSGGGIVNDGSISGDASLTILDSVIGHNRATSSSGAGIYNNGEWGGKATLTIINTTITGNAAEDDGGGIYNDALGGNAILTVSNSTIGGNTALDGGGISSDGALTIVGSTLDHNSAGNFGLGGGIVSGGSLTMVGSTVSSNSASIGGGLYLSGGTVTIAGSAFVGNSAQIGGAIDNAATTVVLNTTLSGNSATGYSGIDGGGIENFSAFTIANSTLCSNSAPVAGGIFNSGPTAMLEIGSTVLSHGTSEAIIANVSGNITSLGYNLSGDDGGGFLNQPTDLINTDPLLGPLQDNGGPTLTHALLPGSPAIDKGTNFAGLEFDQRGPGFARTVGQPSVANAPGDRTDIGAFEVQQVTVLGPGEMIQRLLDLVNAMCSRPQPLRTKLEAALDSLERGSTSAALNQLEAFEHAVEAQVGSSNPALAQLLLAQARNIIQSTRMDM